MPGPKDDIARPLDLDPERAMRAESAPYGIIDIGSNSVRLVVYDTLGRAPLPRFNEKSMCRLGEGLAQTGAIKTENFKRTVDAVRRFRAIADAMGVTRLDATATEAMRRATNGAELKAAIKDGAGIEIRVLTGEEEARHSALGVVSGFFRPVGLIGDMGGGSLEVAEALDDHVGERWVSLPLGALPVEALLEKGLDVAKKEVDAMLADGLPPALAHPVFYPVGGGWRSLAKAHMAEVGAAVPVVHGYSLETTVVRAFAKSLWRGTGVTDAARAAVPSRRERTLPAAALVLDRVLKRLAPERVTFSALGLREGWLYAQLPEAERYRDPLVEAAQLIGLPGARVPQFAAALVGWTAALFPGETAAEMRLRVAACALSDTVWRDHQDLRASESFRRLLSFPFIGITHEERVLLAAAIHARYGGKADDPCLTPAIDLLSKPLRRRATILGRAMTLAYRLSAGAPGVLAESELRIEIDAVRLHVGKAARVPDSEVVVDRLASLAAAIGVKGFEVVEREG